MEAIHVMGVDDMSTQDVFGYFKEYPPAHIEWIDDTSCEYGMQTEEPGCGAHEATARGGACDSPSQSQLRSNPVLTT